MLGKPYYIPDFPRSRLPKYFKELGFKKGAEIGIYKGKFCEKFCREGIEMYAVDSFLPGHVSQSTERSDYIYNYARKVLNRFDNCNIIKKTSIDAVKEIPLESLDFVYIDADHSFKGIAEDIYEWYFRVRKGGIIAGHDYAYTGDDIRAIESYRKHTQVKEVVDAFVKAFNIEKFYIFGRSKEIDIESKNDRYLSFMFFKP
jgi:hypothetical protein